MVEHHAFVPRIWPYQIANALWVALRTARIQPDGVQEFADDLLRLDIREQSASPDVLLLVASS